MNNIATPDDIFIARTKNTVSRKILKTYFSSVRVHFVSHVKIIGQAVARKFQSNFLRNFSKYERSIFFNFILRSKYSTLFSI